MTPPMTVPHHSEPAREAVARAIHLNAITALPDEVWGLLNKLPTDELRVIFARLAAGALSASLAPAAGGLEAVRAALECAVRDLTATYEAAKTGKPIEISLGQFMRLRSMREVLEPSNG